MNFEDPRTFEQQCTDQILSRRRLLARNIRKTAKDWAGPKPPRHYQGHEFVDIQLDLGKTDFANIGRYSGICIHPGHRSKSKYPNCFQRRMITLPLQGAKYYRLRELAGKYTQIGAPWGRGLHPWRTCPIGATRVPDDEEERARAADAPKFKELFEGEEVEEAENEAVSNGHEWFGFFEIME
ncbi:hypothetical protein CC2G_008226 [Coprinopsis cinerea AmutBmut pab1-1]|nr:hypothetical protein CC2G_008226 [Coprinopsis cinerea AmutBmut pab1-1]